MDVLLDHIAKISMNQAIDIALNVVGFLAAGGLMMVLTSMFRGKRETVETGRQTAVSELSTATAPVSPQEQTKSRISFVSFGAQASPENSTTPDATPSNRIAERGRRNRAEVIRLAREMIEARQSREAIRNRLPITEAELAMLSND